MRLSAAGAIKECVDVSYSSFCDVLGAKKTFIVITQTISFEPPVFLPHLPAAVWQLVTLAGEVEEFETKRRVTNSLNVVIERMGTLVQSFLCL